MADIVKQPINFISKVKRFIKKNSKDLGKVHPAFSLLNLEKPNSFIGSSCQKLGITKDVIKHFESYDNAFVPTNGSLLDLEDYRVKQSLTYQHFAEIINKLSFHKFSFDKNSIRYYCKKIKENHSGLLEIGKKNRNTFVSDFLESVFFVSSEKTSFVTEQLENASLESIQNQNKQLLTKLDDSSKIFFF